MMETFSRLRGPGRVMNRGQVPQQRQIWRDEIQPSPFVGRTRNKSNRVIIDDDSITVDGVDGTVIIDGSSNMFKIAATGTLQVSLAGSSANVRATSTTTTLTALGTISAPMAIVPQLAWNAFAESFQNARAANLVGTYDTGVDYTGDGVNKDLAISDFVELDSIQTGGNQEQIKLYYIQNGGVGAVTVKGRYYVMIEAAI